MGSLEIMSWSWDSILTVFSSWSQGSLSWSWSWHTILGLGLAIAVLLLSLESRDRDSARHAFTGKTHQWWLVAISILRESASRDPSALGDIYIIKTAQFDFLSVSRAQSTIHRVTIVQSAIVALTC